MPWAELLLLIALFAPAIVYAVGQIRLSRRGHPARRSTAALAFWSGWITLLVVLTGPLDRLGEELFWVHMVQHEVLMLVSAPLLVLANPQVRLAWGLPTRVVGAWARLTHAVPIRRAWSWLVQPMPAWTLHALAVWLWHAPPLFDAAIANQGLHILQHATFFGSALLFWWSLLRPAAPAMAFLYVFTTLLHTGFLGMLLTFSTAPWYSAYATTTSAWGLTTLEDQQLGGLVMWVPAGAILLLAGLALVARMPDRLMRASTQRRSRVRPG